MKRVDSVRDRADKTRVVHCKRTPYDVYIGRPSKWGNPFSHRASGILGVRIVGSREEAIQAYREWLVVERSDLLAQLSELRGKVLGCWCAPLACHGDVLAELADGAAAWAYGSGPGTLAGNEDL